ncbi:MAG: GNAT family N-acetyltransferase [Gammaproteobacteria bacterium]|nr:GNAT family N-acetyltransferase [Gammaproteobacteria bacterium]
MSNSDIEWSVASFDELELRQLYAILAARAAVFVVEQDCSYQDLDDFDVEGIHLWAARAHDRVLAYARLLPPGLRFGEPSIGRVLTVTSCRGQGLGKDLMIRSLNEASARFPGEAIRISAQQYLERFYRDLGFKTARGPYLEDGIPHLEMVRSE